MAEENKSDECKLRYGDYINIKEESAKIQMMMEMALTPPDDTWTKYNTKDDAISVVYKQIGDSSAYTGRGQLVMQGDIDSYYEYQECGYDDVYNRSLKDDPKCTDLRIIKLIDANHQAVYSANLSGFFMIAPRDFVYIKTRFKRTDYSLNGKKFKKVVGQIAYSVPHSHPLSVPSPPPHVRGEIVYSGYVLSQTDDMKDGTFSVSYILCMDAKGSIPSWVVNQFAPSKGMEVKKFRDKWHDIAQTLKDRKKNQWEKQHKPLFGTIVDHVN